MTQPQEPAHSSKSQARFTPGPWAWRSFDGGDTYSLFTAHSGAQVILSGRPQIYTRGPNGYLERVRPDFPDCRLIAAAPELLEACRIVVEDHDEDRCNICRDAGMTPPYPKCDCDICAPARAAIRKATGGEG